MIEAATIFRREGLKRMRIEHWIMALALAAPAGAQAQENRDLRIRVGAGAEWRPTYPGSSRGEVAPLPSFSIARGDKPFGFGTPDDGLSPTLLTAGPVEIGPAAALVSGRDRGEAGPGIAKVGRTVEVGAFGAIEIADSLRFRAMVRKGINGHEGVTATVALDQIWRDGDDYVVSVGPRLLWSNARYQRAFFGVGAAEAPIAGLPAYRPGSGFHAAALQGAFHTRLSGNFGLFGQARAERLIGDAGRSPLVRTRGDRNQFSVGGGVSYTFRIKRAPRAQ